MKRLFGFLFLLTLAVTSCASLGTEQTPAANVDMQATIDAMVQTAAEQTVAVQPSPMPASPLSTETATSAPSPIPATATNSPTSVPSSTPLPNLTTTPATATSGVSETPTSTLAPSAKPTQTATAGPLLYGTLPPAVPSASITVINKSKRQAYISLQNYPPNRPAAFLEYPVKNRIEMDAPLGYYVYVVWVGGRQMIGSFRLHKGDSLTIVIFKDRVLVK